MKNICFTFKYSLHKISQKHRLPLVRIFPPTILPYTEECGYDFVYIRKAEIKNIPYFGIF